MSHTITKSMSKKVDKIYNISVVGLSGTEKEKGSLGVGKSCLINRFVRPLADDYYTDHISVLSESDFAGRVVNNDHFLYWGSTRKVDDGAEYVFRIVEQTEFVDDSSFQPFKIGKTDPYYKRCAACKLQSAEKLAYICKNQLGLEHEFDEHLMPDGRFNVDGFICVFDVSTTSNRPIEVQLDHMHCILTQLIRTKKPITIATTKNDQAYKPFAAEVEKLVLKKDLKERGIIPIVETSAHENVNVEAAFMSLVHLIEKTPKNRSKVPSYADAHRVVMETKEITENAFMSLIKSHVGTDYKALWIPIHQQLQSNADFLSYIQLFGTDQAGRVFRKYLITVKEEYIKMKQKKYLERLECVLKEVLPNFDAVADKSWYSMLLWLKKHDKFMSHFVVLPDNMQWMDSALLDRNDGRIPLDLLETHQAELVYRNYVNHLRVEKRKIEYKREFRQMLEENKHMRPGQSLQEVSIYFVGRECFSSLSDKDKLDIFDDYQKVLKDRAKLDFQELLHENAELFTRYENCQISNDDVKDINNKLQQEYRYKHLSYLEEDRRSLILNHLGFIQRASKERCMFRESCSDHQIETILNDKLYDCIEVMMNGGGADHLSNNCNLHFAIVGQYELALEFYQDIHALLENDQLRIDDDLLTIEFHIINQNFNFCCNIKNNVDQLVQLDVQPNFKFHGFFLVCSSPSSLDSFRISLPHFIKRTNAATLPVPASSTATPLTTTTTHINCAEPADTDTPIVLVLGHDPLITEQELNHLRDGGVTLSKRIETNGEIVLVCVIVRKGQPGILPRNEHWALLQIRVERL
ncbi:hypothetical protein HELRODRAFT_173861 [Helobdella robusta]|uniref:Uncharacterized protein n=1 Tax=Helobdella robusta TaxID=6412 RepID=T1F7B6_HELRO|nr:hypothetical protein HELRODRAFT_173861 [Helobdella robusta]ESO03014.1 hypothetical protein HELRODRAFT_173861 [Helobdella robusta]